MKNNQKGFGHLAVVVLLVVVLAVGGVGLYVFSKDKSETAESTNETAAEADIELQNIGIDDIDNVLVSNNALREFDAHGLKGFYVFGEPLEGGRLNPTFEYASLKEGTKAVAAIDGVVTFVREQTDTKDYEVFVQPADGSAWTIGYDHLKNLLVKQGDTVKAGDPLGEPAMQNNGLLRFEVQINHDVNGVTTHHCPTNMLAESVKPTIEAQLLKMQNDWESISGKELYDTQAQSPVGCLMKSMTVAQSEGR